MDLALLSYVFVVIFISSLIRVVFGFGNALLAMPLLAMTSLGIKVVTPLVALVAATLALQILYSAWKSVDIRSAWRLILSSLLGIPVGLYLIKVADDAVVKMILALVILGFSFYSLTNPGRRTKISEHASYLFGFVSGILGGAYNANGPPIVIYGTMRKWPPEEFRANLQGYFFPTSLIILSSHALGGLWTAPVGKLYLLAIPAMVAAMLIGNRIHKALPRNRFEMAIHTLLIVVALILIFHVLFS